MCASPVLLHCKISGGATANLDVVPSAKLGVALPPTLGVAPPVREWSKLKQNSSEVPRPHICRGAFSGQGIVWTVSLALH